VVGIDNPSTRYCPLVFPEGLVGGDTWSKLGLHRSLAEEFIENFKLTWRGA